MKPIIRYLRFHYPTPTSRPVPNRDGVLAVAAVKETAGLARLLLVDMGLWGRNSGASVTNAACTLVGEAHRRLISGFGIALADTMCVELDRSGHFDLLADLRDGAGLRHSPVTAGERSLRPRSRDAFLWWAGDMGRQMLRTVDAMREGEWAGAEG